jgi:two-component system LytT family sensor kinase
MRTNVFMQNKKPGLLFSRYRLVLHILFWAGIVFYDVLIWGLVDGKYGEKLISTLVELPIKIGAAYFTLYILIDKYLVQKRYSIFLLLLIISMAVCGMVLRVISYFILYPVYYPEGLTIPLFFPPKILIAIFYTYSWVAIVSTFHLIKYYYQHQQATQRLEQTAQQLEKEKLAAELKLLKSQINPHFLFNTLNNLYVLTLNNSEKAPQMVHKLSELMSYMLYDSNQAEVLLDKEIQYIQNYIDLEKLRYGDRLEVSFINYAVPNDITIAPLLMLPFVENSFKHGVRNQLKGSWIHIDIEVVSDILILKVENNKPERQPEKKDLPAIGLQNVTRRLEHLYPKRHSLQLFDEPDTYMAVLKLSLSSNPIQQSVSEAVN